ncbi:UNVERIFIED_CONTAM: hypothetical protein Scaly_0046800 [Sesamum calycinum]|uniref:Reverse transcriptase Ty1/copia-type domain-containing protein n=1 Tax=Sesamum calycinum TaxID=2727403 RepID=A0AAW2SUK9_9LAMI
MRLFLAKATEHNWPIQQLDINNAFLHGHLDEDVYMNPPEGYNVPPAGLMALLVYVDDILISEPSLSDIQHVKDCLNDLFTINDIGDARYLLGLEIACSATGVFVAQKNTATS